MTKKEIRNFYDDQIALVERKIQKGDLDPKQIGALLDVHEKLIKARDGQKTQVDYKLISDICLKLVEIGAYGFITFAGYKFTERIALMSYDKDEAMMMSNGRVFNLKNDIQKLLPKK